LDARVRVSTRGGCRREGGCRRREKVINQQERDEKRNIPKTARSIERAVVMSSRRRENPHALALDARVRVSAARKTPCARIWGEGKGVNAREGVDARGCRRERVSTRE